MDKGSQRQGKISKCIEKPFKLEDTEGRGKIDRHEKLNSNQRLTC